MIVELLEEKKEFTNSEIQIAEFILKNPFAVLDMTASELGERTYTSKASVFRLCKKLDISSFEDFKRQIEREMKEKERLKNLLKQEPFHRSSSLKDIIHIIPSLYDKAVSNTCIAMDEAVIRRIVRYLKEADKIDIYGSGITSSCAEAAMFKFLSIGKECTVHSAVNEHYAMAVKGRKTVAILLSFTGKNMGMVRIAKYLRQAGMRIIGIGGSESDVLRKLCHEYITIYQKDLIMSLEMLTPYISMTYIFDILFASLLVADYDNQLKHAIDVLKITDSNKMMEKVSGKEKGNNQ